VEFPKNMDEKAIAFFNKTVSVSPINRMNADSALTHTWITGVGSINDTRTINDFI